MTETNIRQIKLARALQYAMRPSEIYRTIKKNVIKDRRVEFIINSGDGEANKVNRCTDHYNSLSIGENLLTENSDQIIWSTEKERGMGFHVFPQKQK